jgi:hypothetical protein
VSAKISQPPTPSSILRSVDRLGSHRAERFACDAVGALDLVAATGHSHVDDDGTLEAWHRCAISLPDRRIVGMLPGSASKAAARCERSGAALIHVQLNSAVHERPSSWTTLRIP